MAYLYKIVLLLFIGLIMIDPTNLIFHKKEILFVGLIGVAVIAKKIKCYDVQIQYTLIFVMMALLSIITGALFWGADLQGASSYFKSIAFVVIAFVLSKLTIEDLLRCLFYVGSFLAAYIVLLYICYLTHVINLDSLIDASANANNTIMIALRKFMGFDMIMFFYKSMPFCFFAFIYSLRRNLIIPAVIIGVAIVVGGSRTPILMGMAILFFIISSKSGKFFRILTPIVLTVVLVSVIVSLLSVDNQEGGDELKFSTVTELLSQSSIVGHGVGATYYSSERGMVSNSEMTYFEMLYHYGWLMTPIVLFLFFSPVIIIYRKSKDVITRDFAVAYLAYLINAGTNPLLINSTGIFVFACAITIMAKVKEDNKRTIRIQIAKASDNDSNFISNI